jgi:hypothetical protein
VKYFAGESFILVDYKLKQELQIAALTCLLKSNRRILRNLYFANNCISDKGMADLLLELVDRSQFFNGVKIKTFFYEKNVVGHNLVEALFIFM